MAQLINEAKRFQKLANIKENATSAPAPVAPAAAKQTADAAKVAKLIEANTTIMTALQNINNAQEITDTIAFILNTINPKVSGVNKNKLKSIIDQRFK